MLKYGYAGKILVIDLTSQEVKEEVLEEKTAKNFLGGAGLSVKLAYDYSVPGVDPLAPESVFVLGSGALGGTALPGSAKTSLVTKFPMTNNYGIGGAGGSFGLMLKQAGYDQVVVKGKAAKPVFLSIGEKVELIAADDLWGKDIYETTEELWKRYETCSVLAIGKAGENLVKLSLSFIDNMGSLGRGGFGAVLGSKNLKAIVVTPANRGLKLADEKAFFDIINHAYDLIRSDPLKPKWLREGVKIGWPSWVKVDFVYKDWKTVFPKELAAKLYEPERFHELFAKRTPACATCPISDKSVYTIKSGQFAGECIYAAEFLQAMLSFGIKCNFGDNYEMMMKGIDIANREGIDVFTFSNIMAFAVQLFENGILSLEEVGGKEIELDPPTALDLLHKIIYREGIGDILAEGWIGAVQRIGRGSKEYAVQIKGLEPAHTEARTIFNPEAFENLVNPKVHPFHAECPSILPQRTSDKIYRHCMSINVPEDRIDVIFDTPRGFNVARLARYNEDWFGVFGSLGICGRQQIITRYSAKIFNDAFVAATGLEMDLDAMTAAGERMWNLLRAMNYREGFDRKDDQFPKVWLEPIKGDGREIKLEDYYHTEQLTADDLERLLDDYYDERGWDINLGVPTEEKLIALDLEDVAMNLKEKGLL